MTDITLLHPSLPAHFPAAQTSELPATGLCWLSHEGILSVSGADAKRFLQGQLTCDVNLLPSPGSTLGARCNPKGRVQSSFRLVRYAEDTYLLALHHDLLQAQNTDLGKYAVFFKARITDASADWVRLGLWGDEAAAALQQADLIAPQEIDQVSVNPGGAVIRVPGAERFELWLPRETALHTLNQLQTCATPAALNAWQLLQIRNGMGEVNAASWERYIPQMLNLQQFNAISFRKGCYTGQEIVARMQYLGKLKRRMFRLLLEGDQRLPAGSLIVNRDTGQTLGDVVMSARSGNKVEILAVLQKDAAQLQPLALKDSEGLSLTVADLPYDTDLAADEAGAAH